LISSEIYSAPHPKLFDSEGYSAATLIHDGGVDTSLITDRDFVDRNSMVKGEAGAIAGEANDTKLNSAEMNSTTFMNRSSVEAESVQGESDYTSSNDARHPKSRFNVSESLENVTHKTIPTNSRLDLTNEYFPGNEANHSINSNSANLILANRRSKGSSELIPFNETQSDNRNFKQIISFDESDRRKFRNETTLFSQINSTTTFASQNLKFYESPGILTTNYYLASSVQKTSKVDNTSEEVP